MVLDLREHGFEKDVIAVARQKMDIGTPPDVRSKGADLVLLDIDQVVGEERRL